MSDSETESELDVVQQALERQEQIIQELIEKIAALTAATAHAPPGLAEVLVTDKVQNQLPAQGVLPIKPLQLPGEEWLKEKLDRIEKLENFVRKSRGSDD